MTARINRFLLEQTRYDSGELNQPGFVVHQYPRAGHYRIEVRRHDQVRCVLDLDVDAECSEKQVSIDLAACDKPAPDTGCGCQKTAHRFRLDKEGFALFYVGSGAGGYRVRSYPVSAKDEELLFDSAHLQKGDLFGTTLLRPGRYRVEELHQKLQTYLVVAPVKPGTTRYVPPEPLHLALDSFRKQKDGLRLQQAQGIIFHAEHDNRVQIVLEEDTRPQDAPSAPVARWTKASARRR